MRLTVRGLILAISGVLAAAGGCPLRRSGGSSPSLPSLPPPGEGPANAVELTVYFLSLPRATAGGWFAANFWRRADENITAPDIADLWRANGLRLGKVSAKVVEEAADFCLARRRQKGPICQVSRLRLPHRSRALVALSPALGARTFLITIPGRQVLIRRYPSVSVGLEVTGRVIDDDTAYLELTPRVVLAGGGEAERTLTDFLTTEVALRRGEGVLVGLGQPTQSTIGWPLMVLGRGGENPHEQLLVISAEPICLTPRGRGTGRKSP